jgi:hypothetical protein
MSRYRDKLVGVQAKVIVFDSYNSSSDGPTIRIDVHSLGRLNELESIMRDLGAGKSQRFLLSKITDAHWVPPLEDIALTVSEAVPHSSNLPRGERLICQWTDSLEGWIESAEQIAAMTASPEPCHQYFGGWHADSITIEIAFLE